MSGDVRPVARKAWRVGKWNPLQGGYEIDYYKGGVRQCTFIGRPDDKRGVFYLRLDARYPYGEVPARRTVYFSETEREKE